MAWPAEIRPWQRAGRDRGSRRGVALGVDDSLPDTLIAKAQELGLKPIDLKLWIYDSPDHDWTPGTLEGWARRMHLTAPLAHCAHCEKGLYTTAELRTHQCGRERQPSAAARRNRGMSPVPIERVEVHLTGQQRRRLSVTCAPIRDYATPRPISRKPSTLGTPFARRQRRGEAGRQVVQLLAKGTGSYVAPNPPVNKATRSRSPAELDRRGVENRHGGVTREPGAGSRLGLMPNSGAQPAKSKTLSKERGDAIPRWPLFQAVQAPGGHRFGTGRDSGIADADLFRVAGHVPLHRGWSRWSAREQWAHGKGRRQSNIYALRSLGQGAGQRAAGGKD